jgi:sec-independent protein translocase protein TatA
VFGTKKLKNIGQDLGGAVKGFKEGMKDGGTAENAKVEEAKQVSAKTIEVEAKEKTNS